MVYEICGKCLHARSCHDTINGTLMYCAICGKPCDTEEFKINHKPSKTIIQDGVIMQL